MHHHLLEIEKPGRYTGSEYGSVVKDHREVGVKVALCYPDVYELGMSHLGSQILYREINRRADALVERVYAPWPDMERLLRRSGVPLFTLESGRPVSEFDVLAVTLQYELTYSNILNILSLSDIPLTTGQRRQARQQGRAVPLVIAGGPCAFNPEPLAPFLDAVVLGDGEEVVHELLDALLAAGPLELGARCLDQQLQRLAAVPGVYVPDFYRVEHNPDGTVMSVSPRNEGAPSQVRRRIVPDLDDLEPPICPVVPFIEVVHDRAVVELFRGCTRGCRFCQAGMLYRPVRERSPGQVVRQALDALRHSGHDELSLVSLSATDYTAMDAVSSCLLDRLSGSGVGLSLPSLRIDSLSVEAARRVGQVRRSGLTLAPEAGTQRLRDVINKGVTAADFRQAVTAAFTAGWDALKLYFMVGLPTETEADMRGIVDMVNQVHLLRAPFRGRGVRGLRVNVSLAGFVPKPHTPFQWAAQDSAADLNAKASGIKSALGQAARVSYGDPQASRLEGVLARGDRRLAAVIARAYEAGARFDAWTEHFDPSIWWRAMQDAGLDPDFYAGRVRPRAEVLPWGHLDSGVSTDFLWGEYERALAGDLTSDCRWDGCHGCGVCPAVGILPRLVAGGRDS